MCVALGGDMLGIQMLKRWWNWLSGAGKTASLLGALTGAISLFNLLAKLFGLHLKEVFLQLIDAYRYLFHQILFDHVFCWLPIKHVPEGIKDIFALYALGGGILISSVAMAERKLGGKALSLGGMSRSKKFQGSGFPSAGHAFRAAAEMHLAQARQLFHGRYRHFT